MHVLRVQRLALDVVEREVLHHPGFSQRFEVENAGVMCLVKQCVLIRQQSALSSVLSSEECSKIEACSIETYSFWQHNILVHMWLAVSCVDSVQRL